MAKDTDDDGALDRVAKRLGEVADRLQALEERLDGIDDRLDAIDERTTGAAVPAPVAAPPATWTTVRRPADEMHRPARPSPPPMEPVPAAPVAPEPIPRVARPKRDLETLVGGNLLAKAGIAILVLGVVFLLRLAFDQGWIGPRGRIALGIVGGLALAVGGELLWRKGRTGRLYPQVLAGGGIVIAYFTVYAAYAFVEYREILGLTIHAPSIALGVLAGGLAAYAHWREAPVLAGQAAVLGGIAILFGGTWVPFAIAYALLLSLGVSAVAARHGWRYVAYMALVSPAAALLVPAVGGDVPIAWAVAAALLVSFVAVVVSLWRGWDDLSYVGIGVAHGFVIVMASTGKADLPSLVLLGAFFVAVLVGAMRRHAAVIGCVATALTLVTLATFPAEAVDLRVPAWAALVTAVALLGLVAATLGRWSFMGAFVVVAAQVPLVVVAKFAIPLDATAMTTAWLAAAFVAVGASVAAFAWFVDHPVTSYLSAAALALTGGIIVVDSGLSQMQWLVTGMLVAIALVAASTPRVWVYGGLAGALLAAWTIQITPDPATSGLVAAVMLPLLAVPFAARVRVMDEAERRTLAVFAGLTLLVGALLALRAEGTLERENWRGPTIAAFAVVGMVTAALWRGAAREARIGWGAAGLVLAAAWPPVQFDGSATAVSWTVMLAVLAGVMWMRPRMWVQAAILVFVALATGHVWFMELARIDDGEIAFASGLFVVGLLTLALVFAWAALAARPIGLGAMSVRESAPWNMALRDIPLAAGVLLPVLYLATLLEGVVISLAWAGEAALFVGAGFVARQKELRLAGLALVVLVLGRIAFVDIKAFEPVFRVITFIGVGVLFLAIAFLYARRQRRTSDEDAVSEP